MDPGALAFSAPYLGIGPGHEQPGRRVRPLPSLHSMAYGFQEVRASVNGRPGGRNRPNSFVEASICVSTRIGSQHMHPESV